VTWQRGVAKDEPAKPVIVERQEPIIPLHTEAEGTSKIS